MARNRVIYQSEALFLNQDAAYSGGYNQLERIQSANYSYTINRQDVNQYGQLGKLDSIILDAPTVSADISYYLTDGFTERALGFYLATGTGTLASNWHVSSGSFISGHLADSSGRNLIILTTPEGTDADLPVRSLTGSTVKNSVIGVGNCYLSDYSLDLSVGAIPTVSVSFDALNINATGGVTGCNPVTNLGSGIWGIPSPAIKPVDGTAVIGAQALPDAVTGYTGLGSTSVAALRPGDITVQIGNFMGSGVVNIGTGADGTPDADSAHIQSASLSIPLGRSTLERLGSRSAYSRSIDFPIVASLSISAILNEVESYNLVTGLQDTSEKDITLTLKDSDSVPAMVYTLKGCSFDSESITSSIGANKSVDMTFTTSVGGPNDTAHGIFVSGISTGALYTGVNYATEPD